MNIHKLLIFAIVFSIFSCQTNKENKDTTTVSENVTVENSFEFGVWTTASNEKSNEEYAKEF